MTYSPRKRVNNEEKSKACDKRDEWLLARERNLV
jgi:hypothetical protein